MGIANKETDVMSACLQYLGLRGVFCWRSNNTPVYDSTRKRYRAFRGLKGVSDILGVLPTGLFLAVEVKKPGGRKSEEQEWFIDEVRKLGGVAMCVDSVAELASALESVLEAQRPRMFESAG